MNMDIILIYTLSIKSCIFGLQLHTFLAKREKKPSQTGESTTSEALQMGQLE